MKIAVGKKLVTGDIVKFIVELPDEYKKYRPEFLASHFSHYILGAVIDLRAPKYLPLVIQLNNQWQDMKIGLLAKVSSGVDVELLEHVMEKVDLDFITLKGEEQKDWVTDKE